MLLNTFRHLVNFGVIGTEKITNLWELHIIRMKTRTHRPVVLLAELARRTGMERRKATELNLVLGLQSLGIFSEKEEQEKTREQNLVQRLQHLGISSQETGKKK